PVFTTASLSGTTLTLAGYVGSAAGQATFAGARVEVFKSSVDASGFGEGQVYLGVLTANASGDFSGTLTVSGVSLGDKVTGTATDGSSNSSEFGANLTVLGPPPVVGLTVAVSPSGTVLPGTDLSYTLTFSNTGGSSAANLVLVDSLKTNVDFKLGSVTTNPGTSGLTATVSYSNDGGLTWSYVPASGAGGAPAGYDRSVTHVRWTFSGMLSQTAPNNAVSVGVVARIR
ncbi:MAG TPA: hypothetical protein VFV33_10695, partial [Gemmatimonadaceae bacterium]|nr:hypothetical protein [Gemmatimonadaceae bacterium]